MESQDQTQIPSGVDDQLNQEQELSPEQKRTIVILVLTVLFILVLAVGLVVVLFTRPPAKVEFIRDVMIILMAFQSLLLGLVLIILIIQLARLTNLLQNEVRPILDSLNETISNLRGTTVFLSENVTEPIIKLNEYMAGLNQFWAALGLVRKSTRKRSPTGE